MRNLINAMQYIVYTALIGMLLYIIVPRIHEKYLETKFKISLRNAGFMAHALENYFNDHGTYPLPGHSGPSSALKYLKGEFPRNNFDYCDGWGHDILYFGIEEGQRYFIVATNRDGIMTFDMKKSFQMNSPIIVFDYDSDLVISDDAYFQYLDGSLGGDVFNSSQRERHIQIRILKQAMRILQKDPDNGHAMADKGMALSFLGYYDIAASVLNKVVEVDPMNQGAWRELGRSWLNMEEFQKSGVALDKAIKLKENDNQALFLIAYLHLFQGQIDQGLRYLRSVGIDDSEVLGHAQWLVDRLKEFENRDFHFEQVTESNWAEMNRRFSLLKDCPLAAYKQAQISYQIMKKEVATTCLASAVEEAPYFMYKAKQDMPDITVTSKPMANLEQLLSR
jgi:tetratricopeptide (TPR) repeat protein